MPDYGIDGIENAFPDNGVLPPDPEPDPEPEDQEAPEIVAQPGSDGSVIGYVVPFHSEATGSEPMLCQWYVSDDDETYTPIGPGTPDLSIVIGDIYTAGTINGWVPDQVLYFYAIYSNGAGTAQTDTVTATYFEEE